jgi:ABC-type multidrug transport system fused ATPase/permease subunit
LLSFKKTHAVDHAAWWPQFCELLGKDKLEYSSLVLVSALLSMADGILHPLFVKRIFDEITAKHGLAQFIVLISGYLALGMVVTLGSAGASFWAKALENRIVETVSRRLLKAYYEKEYASVLEHGYGYFIQRIYRDVSDGLVPLLSLVHTTIKQSALLISLSLVLVYLSWKAFLILTVLIPISAAIGAMLGGKIKALTGREKEQEGAVLSTLTRALAAFRMVKRFNLFANTVRVFDGHLKTYLTTSVERYRITRKFQAIIDLTMVVSDFLSMLVGALFVLQGKLSFGAYLAFVNAFWRAVTTLMQIFKSAPDFHSLGVVVARIVSFLSTPATVYHRTGNSLAVRQIEFSYGLIPILQDLSLQVSPGERVIMVGPNGSGKTTLAHILSGYLAPSKGDVFLPESISSITLPIVFPPMKVRDLVSDTELLAMFHLADPVLLEAEADELSAGQQQKLALIVALSKKADLYLLDEPLANLDMESRDIAMHLILERTKGKTLILIMHGSEEYQPLFDRVIRLGLPQVIKEPGNNLGLMAKSS